MPFVVSPPFFDLVQFMDSKVFDHLEVVIWRPTDELVATLKNPSAWNSVLRVGTEKFVVIHSRLVWIEIQCNCRLAVHFNFFFFNNF